MTETSVTSLICVLPCAAVYSARDYCRLRAGGWKRSKEQLCVVYAVPPLPSHCWPASGWTAERENMHLEHFLILRTNTMIIANVRGGPIHVGLSWKIFGSKVARCCCCTLGTVTDACECLPVAKSLESHAFLISEQTDKQRTVLPSLTPPRSPLPQARCTCLLGNQCTVPCA